MIVARGAAVGLVALACLGRRSSAFAVLGGALLGGAALQDSAEAKLKSLSKDDDMGDFSKLNSMLSKDFNKAQDGTKCKTAEEGEERSFCLTKEVNDRNRAAAEAKGEKYVDQKGTLSKGSYGV